jgi:hypothetical protein
MKFSRRDNREEVDGANQELIPDDDAYVFDEHSKPDCRRVSAAWHYALYSFGKKKMAGGIPP